MALSKRDFLLAAPLAVIGLWIVPGLATAAEGVAQVSRLSGTVTVLRDSGEITPAVGDEIKVEDTIRSGPGSRAEVTFSDGSVLTIGPDSEVAVAFFAPEPSESTALLDLVSGIARMTVNKATSWGRFEVRTTTAVASVRGTDYLVEAIPGKSAIFVNEGRVAVSSRAGSGTVILRQGQGVDVPAERGPLTVKTWGEKRRNEALARVTFS